MTNEVKSARPTDPQGVGGERGQVVLDVTVDGPPRGRLAGTASAVAAELTNEDPGPAPSERDRQRAFEKRPPVLRKARNEHEYRPPRGPNERAMLGQNQSKPIFGPNFVFAGEKDHDYPFGAPGLVDSTRRMRALSRSRLTQPLDPSRQVNKNSAR